MTLAHDDRFDHEDEYNGYQEAETAEKAERVRDALEDWAAATKRLFDTFEKLGVLDGWSPSSTSVFGTVPAMRLTRAQIEDVAQADARAQIVHWLERDVQAAVEQ